MIKIQKPNAPQILVDNQDTWTNCLLSAVAFYGGYSKIPEAEKKSLLAHYKHKDIQEALFESSHHKCEKTDLEEETVDEVLRILKSEFEEGEN